MALLSPSRRCCFDDCVPSGLVTLAWIGGQPFAPAIQVGHFLIELFQGLARRLDLLLDLAHLGLLQRGVEFLAARVLQLLHLFGECFRLVGELLDVGGNLGELLLVAALEAGAADVHEEVGETQQVVLLPDVVRMSMALGAFQPQSQERMSHLQRTRHSRGRAALPVQVRCLALAVHRQVGARGGKAVFQVGDFPGPLLQAPAFPAGGRQDALGELVVR
jgi:hypothetical protein